MNGSKYIPHLSRGSLVRLTGADRHPEAGRQCTVTGILPNPSGRREHQWYDVKFDDSSRGRFLEKNLTGVLEEIPAVNWADFFATFSGRHENWLVQLEILGGENPQPLTSRRLRLKSISAEDSKDNKIILIVGEDETEEVSQLIRNPSRVLLMQTDDRADKSLEIHAEDLVVTMSFRSEVLPELVVSSLSITKS